MSLAGKGAVLLCAAVLCGLPTTLDAQRVEIHGGEGLPQAQEVRRILERGDYRVLARDTVLEEGFHHRGDLVLTDAEVRLEGRVEGSIAVLGGALFVRPAARVTGTIVGLGGGVFPSVLAETGRVLESPLGQRVEVESTAEVVIVRVIPPPAPPRVEVLGLFGLRLPTYDRVDGLTIGWNPTVRPFRDGRLVVRPWAAWRTARGAPAGGIEAEGVIGPLRYDLDVERATQTEDEWIRRDWTNTPAALFLGSDVRDYYESDRVRIAVGPRDGITHRGFLLNPALEALASRDRSLDTRSPWSLFGSLDRPNPDIDEGVLVSLRPRLDVDWRGATSELTGWARVERGLDGPGDFDFTQWRARGRYRMDGLWNHRIRLDGFAMGTFGGEVAPRQRWSYIGGSSLVPTVPMEERLRGDNLVYLESQYRIPVPMIDIPFLGSPHLRLSHRTGTAWVTGEPMPRWDQAVGAGVGIFILYLDVYIDPAAEERRFVVALGLGL